MSEYHDRHSWIGGLVLGTLAFVMGMGFTEGSGEGSWIMPLFWGIIIGLGFIGFGGD